MTIRAYFLSIVLGLSTVLAVLPVGQAVAADTLDRETRARMLGDFLAGSYARKLNDPRAQSRYFQDAFELAPEDKNLGRSALFSALFSGDRELTRETARKLLKAESTESSARAVLAVDAFARGRPSRVRRYATDDTVDQTMGPAMKIVLGWSLADEGRYQSARKTFRSMDSNGYFKSLGELQIAKLEASQGNKEAANAAFDKVEESGIAPMEYTLSRARFEARHGMKAEAIARLEAMLADNPNAEIGPIGDYLDRLSNDRRLPRLSVKAQAARALTEPAFAFFVRVSAPDGAETFLRFSRWIDPEFDRSAIWLAGLLEETHSSMDDPTRAEVTALYASVKPDSPWYVNARLGKASQLFDAERDEDALGVLADVAESHPSYFTREALGRARFFRENWEEALPFYSELVESLSEEDLRANPEPLALRAIIFERLDRWEEAEADFLRTLEYDPDDANTLNYLGYTWVDRGENLTEAFEMIEKAVELEPNSGAITDSLGWAHYKLGQYEQAKIYLERAVVLTPYSATIIDHLGDTYWRLNRKREAHYQWVRALEFDPTEEERETIQAKLDAGINAVPAS